MFCKHCGKSLSENQAFCDDCGTPTAGVSVTKVNPATPAHSHKFHCPHCGSEDLYPITSTEFTSSTSGGGYSAVKGCLGLFLLGPLGLLCGACGSKMKTTVENSTKNYWTCRSCGKKFIDIEDLNAILHEQKSLLTRQKIGIFLIPIISIVFIIWIQNKLFGTTNIPPMFQIILGATVAIFIALPFVVVIAYFANKKKIREIETEKSFLEQNAYGGQDVAR